MIGIAPNLGIITPGLDQADQEALGAADPDLEEADEGNSQAEPTEATKGDAIASAVPVTLSLGRRNRDDPEVKINQLESQLEKAHSTIAKMRTAYLKELTQLRNQLALLSGS